MSRAARAVSKTATGLERRVYQLPAELVAWVQAYQHEQGHRTETAAVASLLTEALGKDETAANIVARLTRKAMTSRHSSARDLFMNEFGPSPRLASACFGETGDVRFVLTNGDTGHFALPGAAP